MQRLIVTIAATMLVASAAYAQTEEEGMAEGQAAAEGDSATAMVSKPEGMDPEKFWPDRNDPDKYKESIRWGVTPVLDQIDADHDLGLKQHDD